MPHPGTQRRLRIELEEKHRSGAVAADEMQGIDEDLIPLDQSDNHRMPLDSRS